MRTSLNIHAVGLAHSFFAECIWPITSLSISNKNASPLALYLFLCGVHFPDSDISLLTHLSRMQFPKLNKWTCPFPVQGLLGGNFQFYSKFERKSYKQTVETLIRRSVLLRMIWVCTICTCPTKRTLGLYGLNIYSCMYMQYNFSIKLSIIYRIGMFDNRFWFGDQIPNALPVLM